MQSPYFISENQVELLVGQFIDKTLPKQEWTHEAHLATAVWHLRQYSPVETLGLMRSRIITYNAAVGGINDLQNGYHETLTVFWIAAVHEFLNKTARDRPVHELCNELFASTLSSRNLAMEFYTREKLFSTETRAVWTEPDKKSLNFSEI